MKFAPITPRMPPTTDMSRASPPKLGVNPPGNRPYKVKQLASDATAASALLSGTLSTIGTVGQLPAPGIPVSAHCRSPTSKVCPRSALKTPPRVFGLRKKNPPVTRLRAKLV